jgi:DNA primase
MSEKTLISAEHVTLTRAVRIEDEIGRRGIKLVGKIDRCGACPNCGGHDRFSINTQKQVFLCRGCNAKGNVIALVQFLDGVAFREAVEILSGNHAIAKDVWKPREPQQRTPATATSTADALKLWAEGVDPQGTLAEIYLATRRLDLGEDLAGAVLRWHPRTRRCSRSSATFGQMSPAP